MAIQIGANGLGFAEDSEPTANEVAYILKELQTNAFYQREQWLREMLDPRRDIAKECGYPTEPTMENYRFMWAREPIASRVVSAMARESWQTSPEVYEDESTKTDTPFEVAWDTLARALRGESWYGDQEGNPIWGLLARADILSGIGQFGIVLLGLDDGLELEKPAEFVKGSKASRRLLFLRAFDQTLVTILQYETDKKSPRFGQPTLYQVMMADPKESTIAGTSLGSDLGTYNVHWTRVIHLADVFHQACSSEILAIPRMRPCYNRLYDLYKTYGGSAEGYWQGAFPGISFETHPQLGGDVEINETQMREQLGKYFNRLQRYMVNSGMVAKSLAPQYVDPTPQIDAALTGICIVLGMPKRVFMGSERGELASSQDDMAWNDRLRQRQREYISPRIVIPFVDRLIKLGVLPEPSEFFIKWPNLDSQSDGEKADVALKRTQAMSAYVQGGLEALITAEDYLAKVLGYTDDEAKAFVKATEGRIEEEDSGGSPLLSLVGGLTGISELFKTAQAGGMSEEQLKQILMLFFKLSEAKADAIIADGLPEPPAPPAIAAPGAGKGIPGGAPGKPPIGTGAPPPAPGIPAKGLPTPKKPPAKKPTTNGGSRKGNRPFVQEAVDNYNPNQPRDKAGRFGSGGSSIQTGKGETLHEVTKTGKGPWVDSKGREAPEHIQKLGIPPAWKNVFANPNPKGDLLARGTDAKGRTQLKYSDTHNAKAAAAKFGRVSELRRKRESIFKEVEQDSKNPAHKENADCLRVVMKTGIRPGGVADTGADHKSYGATTLEGRHVIKNKDGSVSLKFATGKNKGREVEFPISDKKTADMLLNRAKAAGKDGKLFKTDAKSLRDYSKDKDGKGFKTKDHRTALGTEVAIERIKQLGNKQFASMKEYKEAVMDVATKVSKTLGNTPKIALTSYIDPSVFSAWKPMKGAK